MGAWLSLLFTPSNKIVSIHGRKLILETLLGEGGFAFVYRVYDPYTRERFALKKLLCQTDDNMMGAKKELEVFF